jgi:hypothetical protein
MSDNAADSTPDITDELTQSFYEAARDRNGSVPKGSVRLLEKNVKWQGRRSELDSVWPIVAPADEAAREWVASIS